MIITKKALPRRTVLRGMGAMLTLPMLDAMLPALTPTLKAATNVRRLAYFYEPCGTIQDARIQPSSPTGYAMPEVLKTLEPVRKQTLIFSGLANREVLPNGDGNGNHPRACAGWLSGVHIRKTEGADIQAGASPWIHRGLVGNECCGTGQVPREQWRHRRGGIFRCVRAGDSSVNSGD